MAEAKIEIKVGAVSFSGEGEDKWLSDQLDKVLEKIPELANIVPATPAASENSGNSGHDAQTHDSKKANIGTLASFLAAKNAKTPLTRKFLATAVWLHDSTGANRLATGDVKKALATHSQGAVGNASQCLVQNSKQGFVAKEGAKFYVTPEGRTEIGE